jgi:hypothetical protein
MNFLVVGLPYYDYLESTCVQGLMKLGHLCFGASGDTRNYLKSYRSEPIDVFIYAPQDLARDINIEGIPKILLWVHDKVLPDRINEFSPRRFKYDLAFVRELTEEHHNVYPINFGIEDRFYQYTEDWVNNSNSRPIDIIFQGGTSGNYPHASKRSEFLDRLKIDFSKYVLDIGHDKTREPDIDYSRVVNGRHKHYSDYFKALSSSKISLCLHGAGQDCARTWESFASGAVPAIQRYTIRHVEPWWEDGVNCIEFDNYEEFKEKVLYYLAGGHDELLEIQKRAWLFGRTYHRTEHRAHYILDKLQVD